jgi:hypothetical protein
MRNYQVVMKSGASIDITAKSMRDEPACDVIYFFSDENESQLACTVKREEMAGIVFHPRKAGVTTSQTSLASLDFVAAAWR